MIFNNNEDEEVGKNDFVNSVDIYYRELYNNKHKPITREEERKLMKLAQNGDICARNKIIESNLRFVFDMAKKYRGRGVDIADLISAGNEGMIKAMKSFDLNRNVKFFSYAVWSIRQEMDSMVKNHRKYQERELSFDDEFPFDNESLENISREDKEENKNVEPIILDIVEANDELNQKKNIVTTLLNNLEEREKVVITMFYGVNEEEHCYSLDEISKKLNLSTERIRQLKMKAMDKMRCDVFSVESANFLFK